MEQQKVYRGADVALVINQIKEELGDEIEVLHTRSLGKNGVEVTVNYNKANPSKAHAVNLTKEVRRDNDPSNNYLKDIREVLLRQGVHPEFIDRILSAANFNGETFDRIVATGLERHLRFSHIIPGEKRVIALIGSTGVGKTTTAAKLAANVKLALQMEVGLVSADTYRVGGKEQLQAFAQLLDVPYAALPPNLSLAQGIYEAVRDLGQVDLVIVDTAGLNPREGERLRLVAQELGRLEWCEKLLVAAAPSNDIDLRAQARAFSAFNLTRLIITKLDETAFLGPVINTALALKKPLAFLATGQRVPEDIEPASALRLAWMLTRTYH
jgi:flagellar biosynthesis GTPase FlhF